MISRREFLTLCAAAAGSVSIGESSTGAAPRRRAVISGPLWWVDPKQNAAWGASGWRDELDQQARIGFNLLWLVNAPSCLTNEADAAHLRSLMDLCAARKVRVILDTGSSGAWYSPPDLDKELSTCGANVRAVSDHFKGHPAFFAWYIPQEIYMTWPGEAVHNYIHRLYPALSRLCKEAADLPVTLSPFFILDRDRVFGNFRYNEPGEYESYWARLLKQSRIDILMLQDSGEHFSYVTNDQRRPLFQAMSNACKAAGTRFWGNVETAEYLCPSKEEFVGRYGRVHHSTAEGLPWRPVPIERLREKLDLAAEFSEEIVTWGYREFCRPALGDAARKWYEDYRAHYRLARG